MKRFFCWMLLGCSVFVLELEILSPATPPVIKHPWWLDDLLLFVLSLYADVMLSDIHHHPNVNKHPLKAKAPMVSFDQKSLSSNLTWVVEVDSAWKPISAVQPLWPAYVLNGTFNYCYSSCFLTFAHCEPFYMNKNFSVPMRI